MAEIVAKDKVKTLINDAILRAAEQSVSVDKLRGVAFRNLQRDEFLRTLQNFDAAAETVATIPNFTSRFGDDAGTGIILQFLYQYFGRLDDVKFDNTIFEKLWSDFTIELASPNWVFRGVANIKFFQADSMLIDLGDGITIRGRDQDDLRSLGFDDAVWDRLTDDWSGFGASSYVLVAQDDLTKRPDNLTLLDSSVLATKAMRAVQALRLVEAGSVGIGRMWVRRIARFNAGLGGLNTVGASIPTGGNYYLWTNGAAQTYPVVYRELIQLEKGGYGKAPGNLEVALRAFMATYDRYPSFLDSQLLDAITALEAILGTGSTELTFKLAFRVAGLLAASDDERAAIFKLIKEFYDTRSRVVHGGQLTQKHHLRLQSLDELRAFVRRLLRAFVAYAAGPLQAYSKKFFQEDLEVALVHAEKREELRNALRLK